MKDTTVREDIMQAEIIDEMEAEKETTALDRLKVTAKDAFNKSIEGLNKTIRWAIDNPQKALTLLTTVVAGGSLVYNKVSDVRKAHEHTFYDYVNHRTLYLRRELDWHEHMQLCQYLDDRSHGKHYAAEWLADRGLLKK